MSADACNLQNVHLHTQRFDQSVRVFGGQSEKLCNTKRDVIVSEVRNQVLSSPKW